MKYEESMLSGYIDGELTPAELEVVKKQLASSEKDRQLLQSLTDLHAKLKAMPAEVFQEDPVVAVRRRIATMTTEQNAGAPGSGESTPSKEPGENHALGLPTGDLHSESHRASLTPTHQQSAIRRFLPFIAFASAASLAGLMLWRQVESPQLGLNVSSQQDADAPQVETAESPATAAQQPLSRQLSLDSAEPRPAPAAPADSVPKDNLVADGAAPLSDVPPSDVPPPPQARAQAMRRTDGQPAAAAPEAFSAADDKANDLALDAQSFQAPLPSANRSLGRSLAEPMAEEARFDPASIEPARRYSLSLKSKPAISNLEGKTSASDSERLQRRFVAFRLSDDQQGAVTQLLLQPVEKLGDSESEFVQSNLMTEEIQRNLAAGQAVAIRLEGTPQQLAGLVQSLNQLRQTDELARSMAIHSPPPGAGGGSGRADTSVGAGAGAAATGDLEPNAGGLPSGEAIAISQAGAAGAAGKIPAEDAGATRLLGSEAAAGVQAGELWLVLQPVQDEPLPAGPAVP